MTAATLLLAASMLCASAQDTGTDTAVDTGTDTTVDTGTDTTVDTGTDTTVDTGTDGTDTSSTVETTASSMAGEVGGFSCDASGGAGGSLAWLGLLVVLRRRRGDDECQG